MNRDELWTEVGSGADAADAAGQAAVEVPSTWRPCRRQRPNVPGPDWNGGKGGIGTVGDANFVAQSRPGIQMPRCSIKYRCMPRSRDCHQVFNRVPTYWMQATCRYRTRFSQLQNLEPNSEPGLGARSCVLP